MTFAMKRNHTIIFICEMEFKRNAKYSNWSDRVNEMVMEHDGGGGQKINVYEITTYFQINRIAL